MSMQQRQKRLVALTAVLTAHPGQLISLGDLSKQLGAAKSTLSEDLVAVNQALEASGAGVIETTVGALGGVAWRPALDVKRTAACLAAWIEALAEPERRTAEGFLYMTDLLFDPERIAPMGQLLADRMRPLGVEAVATVETKGIPLALATAEHLGVGVVLLRRDSRLSDGSALSINYLSGSSHRIQSMSLSRRAPVQGVRVAFVDDFMKAGGTARAAADLLSEFNARVVGVGVLIATDEPQVKLAGDYVACLAWSPARNAISASPWVEERLRVKRGDERGTSSGA